MRACQVCLGAMSEKEFSSKGNGVMIGGRAKHRVCPPTLAASTKPAQSYPERLEARRELHGALVDLDIAVRSLADLVQSSWLEKLDLDEPIGRISGLLDRVKVMAEPKEEETNA